MYKRILVPLDGSETAEAVLPHALELARLAEGEIFLLSVPTDPAAAFAFGDPGLANEFVDDQESTTQKYLKSIKKDLESKNAKVSMLIRDGAVAHVIISVADEINADIIAMSTHARTGVAHLFLGSVAEKILRASRLPVMLIRPAV